MIARDTIAAVLRAEKSSREPRECQHERLALPAFDEAAARDLSADGPVPGLSKLTTS